MIETFTGADLYVYGVQLKQAPSPRPTSRLQALQTARSADVASIDVDQFGYNQSEGTLFAEAQMFIKDVTLQSDSKPQHQRL